MRKWKNACYVSANTRYSASHASAVLSLGAFFSPGLKGGLEKKKRTFFYTRLGPPCYLDLPTALTHTCTLLPPFVLSSPSCAPTVIHTRYYYLSFTRNCISEALVYPKTTLRDTAAATSLFPFFSVPVHLCILSRVFSRAHRCVCLLHKFTVPSSVVVVLQLLRLCVCVSNL